MLKVEVRGTEALIAKLNAIPSRVREELYRTVTALTLKLEQHVKADKLSGQVLHVRTGALRRSIASKVDQSGSSVIGRVFSSGDVKYAGIHEFGGKTPPHEIVAKGRALAFEMGGQMRFFKRVQHPGSVMPERSFLRSSLSDMRVEIVSEIQEAVRRGTQ